MINRVVYITLLWVVLGSAQNKQLLYDFTQVPQSLMQNPGSDVNFKWHAGIPLLSGVYLNAGSSGFSVYDIFANNGVSINDKIRDVIYTTGANDVMSVHEEVELLFGGFKGGGGWHEKNYYSFGWYQELNHFNYWPHDLAILAYDGNRGYIGQRFNLSHVSVKTELVSVLHFGMLRKVNENLSIGGRFKLYSGIADITSTNNKGRFFTAFGINNEYIHTVIADLELNTSGYKIIDELDDGNDIAHDLYRNFKRRGILGGNLGMGLDFGFSYEFKDNWNLTASILDFGVIHHSKDVKRYSYRGRYDFEGLELVFPGIIDADDDVYDYWENLADDLEELYDTTSTSYTTLRPVRMNAGLSYAFGSKEGKECDCYAYAKGYDNTVGVHFFAIHRPKHPQMALTAYYQKRIADFLYTRVAYTVDKFSATNIGIGLSSHFGNFNLYILADNLLEYQNLADAHNASVQFGINYVVPDRN